MSNFDGRGVNLVKSCKPSDINVSNSLVGSGFNKSELEGNATLFIEVCKKNGDEWLELTPQEYASLRQAQGSNIQDGLATIILKDFVSRGYMNENDGKYSINNKFIGVVASFIA